MDKKIVKDMTLREKASLTSGMDFWQTAKIKRFDMPSMFLSDGPHGIRKQEEAADHLGLNASVKATCFPTAATMANSWNPELGVEMGKALGNEAKVQKVNVLLGPGMNIKRNPKCGRNFEYFSEDPYLAGHMAGSYVKGIQTHKVSACLKHFACNNQETRRMVYNSVIDERALREIYLEGFEIAIKEAKPRTIMTSYNRINGEYANENHHLLREILREDWGYEGMIVSDWGGNNDRVKALVEGATLEMPTTNGETNEDIIRAIENKEIDESVLDESVERYLDVLENTKELLPDGTKFDVEAHHDLARRCAEDSIVLLKNENNVLPLKKTDKVALIGDFFKTPRYQGAGSSIVNPTKITSFVELKDKFEFDYLGFEQGYNRYGKKSNGLANKALKLAENADVILYAMGLDEITECEGLDRKDLYVHSNQILLLNELLKLNKKVVVILSCGSAIDTTWDKDVDGLVYACLSGQAGAEAILNVVEGKVNPSGKLAETFPMTYEDEPTSVDFPCMKANILYKESIYVGYRYFDTFDVKVKYPFGYGLSYSKFEYSDLKVEDDKVTFKVTNTSDVDGSEVTQLYIGKNDSNILRAKKELKGFKKVFVKAQETVEVCINFDEYTFRFFNVKSNKFEVEDGNYEVYICASVSDVKLDGNIKRNGVKVEHINHDIYMKYLSGNIKGLTDEDFQHLYGKELPNEHAPYSRKNKVHVDFNTTVLELRYAKGWTGRFFSWGVRAGEKIMRAFGNYDLANTIIMGVFHNPMRGLNRMSGGLVSWGQLEGMMTMFNGKFFKGANMFFKAGKIKKANMKKLKEEQNAND